jgi:hypothetical protein
MRRRTRPHTHTHTLISHRIDPDEREQARLRTVDFNLSMTRLLTQVRFNAQVLREYWHYIDHVKLTFGRVLLIQQPANKTSMYIKK